MGTRWLVGRDASRLAASNQKMAITLYSTRYCGYCRAAERLLIRKKMPYRLVDVTNDPTERARLVGRALGRRTVPVIFFGDQVIGGYAELKQMDSSGELDRRFQLMRAAIGTQRDVEPKGV
jgi:glutaredoxin 3